jgi:hypothetical protein
MRTSNPTYCISFYIDSSLHYGPPYTRQEAVLLALRELNSSRLREANTSRNVPVSQLTVLLSGPFAPDTTGHTTLRGEGLL